MKFAAIAAFVAFAAMAADGPAEGARLYYSKYFKGSVPETVVITVERTGQVRYQESTNDANPLEIHLPDSQVAEMFQIADKLDRFTHPLESPAKVAHMGIKTFRYEEGSVKNEVKFNFTEDLTARLLADWFERISETEQLYIDLERTVKFDHLGINQVLLYLQVSLDNKRLLAPQQFLPLLDRIAKNSSYMHMSRERAATLADTFRNAEAKGTK